MSATPFRLGLIEDEPAAMERLQNMLKEHQQEFEIAWTADSVSRALDHVFKVDAYDAIITDIQLADGTVFDLFEKFKPICPIVFVTAYDEYLVVAFVVNAIDYLQKPVKREQFQLAIKKLAMRLKSGTGRINYDSLAQAIAQQTEQKDLRYVIRFGEHMRVVTSNEIAYIYTLQKGNYIVLASGKTYPMDKSLDQLEKELDPQRFFRINRQMIVCREAIGPMQIVSKSRVKLTLMPVFVEYESIVSTERSPIFKEWISV
jgi:two-component system, LytTR family, response regulator LytT